MDLTSALSTVTALGELTKLIVSGKVDSQVKAKAAELNNSILSLQGTLFSLQSQNQNLQNEKHEIENKLMKLSLWKDIEESYSLIELCPGVFVYVNKNASEPTHYICPNCFSSQKKSILIKDAMTHSGTSYRCKSQDCKASYDDYSKKVALTYPNRRTI